MAAKKRVCRKWGKAHGRKVCRKWSKKKTSSSKARGKSPKCAHGKLKNPRGRRICKKR